MGQVYTTFKKTCKKELISFEVTLENLNLPGHRLKPGTE